MPITDHKSLVEHLQTALELEHATIPAYLSALYSIPDGSNIEAARVIQSVVMEEMLHLALAANLLNAVKGEPVLDQPGFIPRYPAFLPHSDDAFAVALLRFSPEAIDTFLKIERPAPAGAPPQPDGYATIGQFYQAIEDAFTQLGPGIFSGKRERQVRSEHWYYGAGGGVVEVTNLESALRAIDEIKEQGEGIDHTIFDGDNQFGQTDELAHYFRFNEIRAGRKYQATDTPKSGPTGSEMVVNWSAVYPMRPNPRAGEYVDQPEIHARLMQCNRSYTALLKLLHSAFNGRPDLLINAVPAMYQLKYQVQALMKIPAGSDGTTVGFGFEYAP